LVEPAEMERVPLIDEVALADELARPRSVVGPLDRQRGGGGEQEGADHKSSEPLEPCHGIFPSVCGGNRPANVTPECSSPGHVPGDFLGSRGNATKSAICLTTGEKKSKSRRACRRSVMSPLTCPWCL